MQLFVRRRQFWVLLIISTGLNVDMGPQLTVVPHERSTAHKMYTAGVTSEGGVQHYEFILQAERSV